MSNFINRDKLDLYKTSTINHLYPRMNNILPNLWLGDIEASQDFDALNENEIHYIVSILAQKEFHVPTTHHLLITLSDGEPFTNEILTKGVSFIKDAMKRKESVLVHCMAGISRSTTLISAYLMKELHYTPYQAIKFLQEKREIIDPAYFTFQSAINWVYPNKSMVCKVCNKLWDYREKYEFFLQSKNNDSQRNLKECACKEPVIIFKDTFPSN